MAGWYDGLLKRWCLAVALLLVGAGEPLFAQDHGQYADADIVFGARLYEGQCVTCHGPNGNLVGGVDLQSGKFKNAITSDQQLEALISRGLPTAGMPGFKFNAAELTGIVAFLRNMRSFDSRAIPKGDVTRGQSVFAGKGECTRCHRTDGTGSGLAPDLRGIGTRRTARSIQATLVDPTRGLWPINRPVHLVTKDGKILRGRRLNEDTYTVQIVDEQGRLMSFEKADLRTYTIISESPMPASKEKLNATELADVVAYLLTLKGQ